jgi:hypothetical protein
LLQLINQFAGENREIIDEVEWILHLVRDARGKLTEGSEFLRLNQAVLRSAQVLQRSGQFSCASLHFLEQTHVLDCDYRLISEGLYQLDLLVREQVHVRARYY